MYRILLVFIDRYCENLLNTKIKNIIDFILDGQCMHRKI